MDSALTRPPHTPPRAKSEGPTRPHRDSMEDADSSATRKRPRLDSGDRTYRSMSVDRLRDASTDSAAAKTLSTPPNDQTALIAPGEAGHVPPMTLTPSKVTINVREPAHTLQSSVPIPFSTTSTLRGGGGGKDMPAGDQGIGDKMDASSPNVISVGSSPPQSPEIEVAEVEDMNDDSAGTRWQPLARAATTLEARHVQRTLLSDFPFRQTKKGLRKTLTLIALTIEKNVLEDGNVLQQTAEWIESYLENTEKYSSHWWEMYLEEREFWDEFPSLLDALYRRKLGVGSYFPTLDVSSEEDPLQAFLTAFASLTMRMAEIDIQTLDRLYDASPVPDLVSDHYINSLASVMNYQLAFWKSYVDNPKQDISVVMATIIARLKPRSSNGVARLKHLSRQILDRCPHSPGLIHKVFASISLVSQIIDHYRVLQTSDAEEDQTLLSPIDETSSQAYEMFLIIDDYFQKFISKQIPALSIEVNQQFVWRLSLLLRQIASSDERLTQRIIGERLALQNVGEHGAVLVDLAWKFETLKRCILEGRMEIRVHGVDCMDRDLVSVYNVYVKDSQNFKENADHPVAQYLSDFLLVNKLVDYFVGVESHPQLISRCANIIGFLVVTRRYTEAETDVIWRAITISQDSRFVEALLNMLMGIFGIAKYPTLLYLTEKVNELPIQNFDAPMIKFTRSLFDSLTGKFKDFLNDGNIEPLLQEKFKETLCCRKMDMPPFHLCIRLIRQSASERSLELHKKREIHNFASMELGKRLLGFGPSDTNRRVIYDECLQDISSQTDSATGSISAIHALLSQNYEGEIALLPKDLDLPSLLVGEFAHMIEMERSSPYSPQMLEERLNTRLQLLQDIIIHIPAKITAKTGTQLWNFAVGSEALNDPARENAWMGFIRATRWHGSNRTVCTSRNAFIDQCIGDHLPRLEPRFYTNGCLQFVQDVVVYHSRMAALRLESDVKQESTAEGLLWQLSLTAPRNTIEHKAIGLLVNFYLDSPDVQRRTRAATEAIHVEVVERCIRQLTSAASKLKAFSDGTSSGEDEPMVIVASEGEIQVQRLSFSRSLMILTEFIRGVRARPRYSPQPQIQRQLPREPSEARGEKIQIRYQAANSDMRTVEVGDLETIQGFARRLSLLTGFTKFNLIAGGQRLDLISNADKTLQDLRLDQKGLLLIQRVADADTAPDLAPASGLRPVEKEILCHFPELYDLLTMEDNLGREIFDFLKTFPPHSNVTTLVCSKATPLEILFPSTAPFKIRYSAYALKTSLEYQSKMGSTTPDLIRHGIRSLSAALCSLNLNINSQGADLDISIAKDMVECLEAFLKEPISNDGIDRLFADPLALIDRLDSLIRNALTILDSEDAGSLLSSCFSVLLQVSLLSEVMWSHFKDQVKCSMLLQRCLLDEPRSKIRGQIAESIGRVRGVSKTSHTVPARELVPYLWENLVIIIPFCLELADRSEDYSSEEFFNALRGICETMDRVSCENLDLPTYVQTWNAILLQHVHYEFVGRETKDWIVIGLSSLLKWCFAKANDLGKPIQMSDIFLENLFKAHLFPDLPDSDDGMTTEIRIPNLYTGTRQGLYEILLAVSKDVTNYQKLLILVSNLLCQGEDFQAWSWGIAQPSEGYDFEPNFNFERNKYLRSELGYPGLRNLSNTCYMNSLFTQLFMNVRFRSFILGTNVADGNSSQRLLHETQVLFGFMQETTLKAVDSQGIVDSLVTYDNTLIDVSVQMDVDEFYNLLFDRWEGQILSIADKKKFRAFYGGQIVQQIKSKECDHISERLEPFSAIQCDIQGKMTLSDSLNAYVTGEVMEGDNKYSCTSCGCYVDAVKRACLKNIPDNLIFHLKRFDYDVMTGMRSKINDLFEFPEQIDMAPYHVNHLKEPSQPSQPSKPDIFELVGVLVHSGNAESGHYYSYIKERPPTYMYSKQWVEFNDTDVTKFNPANIADQCFGGFSEHSPYTPRYLKSWNAYMLFYERMQPQTSDVDLQISTPRDVPAKCEIPAEIERLVALNNAKWLRNYCLFDPAHAAFARQLLEQLRIVNKGACSPGHDTEKSAIWQSLDYLQLVLARAKDSTGFGLMLTSLTNVIGACSSCCKLALEWVLEHESALRNVLLRCCVPKVRKDFTNMISMALQYLRKSDPEGYGFSKGDDLDIHNLRADLRQGIFTAIATHLRDLYIYVLPQSRAWDDYFGLLADLANFGVHETHVLLNCGFLQNCLEILAFDHPSVARLRNDHPHLAHYNRLVEKGRKFSFIKLTDLMANLLSKIDVRGTPVRNSYDRPMLATGIRLTVSEDRYLTLAKDSSGSKSLTFLQKILDAGPPPLPATKKIVQYMVLAEPQMRALSSIQQTILNGVNVDPAHMAAPYLQAALAFCECTPTEESAEEVIRHIAREVDTIGTSGGREHLEFFTKARRLRSLRNPVSEGFFNQCVLKTVPQWAPALLMYWDGTIRDATVDILKQLVFGHDVTTMDDEEYAEMMIDAGKRLQVACLTRCNIQIREGKAIDAKCIQQVTAVIKHCLETYCSEDDRDEIARAETTLGSLEALTVSDPDDAVSDTWANNSDEMVSDSDSDYNLVTSP